MTRTNNDTRAEVARTPAAERLAGLVTKCGRGPDPAKMRRSDAASTVELHTAIAAAEDAVDPHAAPTEEPEPFDEATGPMDAPTGTGAVARGMDAPAVLVELARLCLVRHEQYRNIPKWMSEPEPDATDAEWTAYAKWKREDKQREEERLGTLGQIRDFINANRAAIEAAIGGAQ